MKPICPVAPSGTILWRLPDRRELAVLWQVTDYRSGAVVRPGCCQTRTDPSGARKVSRANPTFKLMIPTGGLE